MGPVVKDFLAPVDDTAGRPCTVDAAKSLVTSSTGTNITNTRQVFAGLVARVRAEHKAGAAKAKLATAFAAPVTTNAKNLVTLATQLFAIDVTKDTRVEVLRSIATIAALLHHVLDPAVATLLLPPVNELTKKVARVVKGTAGVNTAAQQLWAAEQALAGLVVRVPAACVYFL